ncbi:MAG TPA: hypothetical protein ENK23_04030 [Sorangium sp.]|nr:hypothetical protein [Sorangium sp.]
MDLNLTLSDEFIEKIARAVEHEADTNTTVLNPGGEMKFELENEFIREAKKYIDMDSGGLKLLDLHIRGRPARFSLVPDFGERSLRINFQYRF